MVTPPSTIYFLGALATLCSLGLFIEFDDDHWTRVLIVFTASGLWLLMGLSAFDVQTYETSTAEPIMALVYVGIGMGSLIALFGVYELLAGLRHEVGDTTADDVFDF